ncbi:hypothetical protein DJ84_14895 [Halorubrum ezzemoulense]|nr:hypothetical protein DJ84_14895 [Halorubrum ezzemoulense]
MLAQSASQIGPAILIIGLVLVLWFGMDQSPFSGTGGETEAVQEAMDETSKTGDVSTNDEVESPSTEKYTSDDLQSMSSSEFREVVAEAYRNQGYDAEAKSRSSPVDVAASGNGEEIGIKAKRYKAGNKVSSSVIDDALAGAMEAGADRAVVVTSSTFTEPAKEQADDRNVELVDVKQLSQWI